MVSVNASLYIDAGLFLDICKAFDFSDIIRRCSVQCKGGYARNRLRLLEIRGRPIHRGHRLSRKWHCSRPSTFRARSGRYVVRFIAGLRKMNLL
jgi:hypothetical protein